MQIAGLVITLGFITMIVVSPLTADKFDGRGMLYSATVIIKCTYMIKNHMHMLLFSY